MTIDLITKEQYDQLVLIQKGFSALTFQNEGYQYPDKSKWTEEDIEAFNTAENIISPNIVGFSKFNHFKTRKTGEVVIRFQYNYGADEDSGTSHSFTGVGYLGLEELYKGFKAKT